MNRINAIGGVCTLLGLLGYILGIIDPYPGRELTIIAVLVGGTLLAVGGAVP